MPCLLSECTDSLVCNDIEQSHDIEIHNDIHIVNSTVVQCLVNMGVNLMSTID